MQRPPVQIWFSLQGARIVELDKQLVCENGGQVEGGIMVLKRALKTKRPGKGKAADEPDDLRAVLARAKTAGKKQQPKKA